MPSPRPPKLIWNPAGPGALSHFDDGRPESSIAHSALLDFLRLGPGRSLQTLLQHYQSLASAPTNSHGTLRKWSYSYDWPARAAAFDALEDQRLQDEFRARRDALLQRGLALEHERIDRLTAWFDRLNALVLDDEAIWIKDIRILHLENNRTERVELRRFNASLIRQLRGLLDDIAAETGGRQTRPAHAAPEKPAFNLGDYSLDMLSPEERAEFVRLQNKIFSSF